MNQVFGNVQNSDKELHTTATDASARRDPTGTPFLGGRFTKSQLMDLPVGIYLQSCVYDDEPLLPVLEAVVTSEHMKEGLWRRICALNVCGRVFWGFCDSESYRVHMEARLLALQAEGLLTPEDARSRLKTIMTSYSQKTKTGAEGRLVPDIVACDNSREMRSTTTQALRSEYLKFIPISKVSKS